MPEADDGAGVNAPTRIRDALESGGVALGARTLTRSPAMIEALGRLGLDYVWIDLEHGGPSAGDATTIADYVRAAEAGGVEPLVRLPSGEGHVVRKVLDAGVRTVLIPRVETAAEVRAALKAARFVYDGEPGARGSASGRAADWGDKPPDYAGREDATTTVGVMIENRHAVADIDAILSVPELGFAFIGPGDLSVSLGHPLSTGHPHVVEAIDGVRAACLDAGVPVGRIADGVDDAIEAVESGYRVVRIGGDVAAARQVLGGRLDGVREGIE